MRILQLIPAFYPAFAYGGTVNAAYNISKELVKRGHQVTVFTSDTIDRNTRQKVRYLEHEGIKIYYFKNISNILAWNRYVFNPGLIRAIKNNIRDFDIVHLHGTRNFQNIVATHYAKKYDIPYIIQAHGSVMPFFGKQNIKKLYDFVWGEKIMRDAKKLIAVSKAEKDQYIKMGLPEKKIEIINNGIELSEYKTLPKRGNFRKKYRIGTDEKIILYLGRLHKVKGLDFLINGFSRLLDNYQNVTLVIVGPDDGFLYSLMKQIKKLHIDRKVLLTGPLYKNEKLEVFVDSDVLVYPGLIEIFGLVPFEAIMCGVPVIVSDDCGCGEIIKEEQIGNVIKYGDITGLSQKITEVLSDPENAKKNVKRGQFYIKKWLTWENNILKFEDLYANCLENN